MTFDASLLDLDLERLGHEMIELIEDAYPICRSITGNGVRATLDLLAHHIPLERHEVPSGEAVLDWTVPREWNIRDAFIRAPDGTKIVDFHQNNLHVLSYSIPVSARLPLSELREHLYSLPEHPDWIPYRTSYYQERWGFCISQRLLESLEEGEYEVVIDSSLEDGSLTYGEYVSRGESDDEVLISAHVCHPSLCNDNLSGLVVSTFVAKLLAATEHRLTYRFLFAPGTIGAITWLARNEDHAVKIRHGLVAANLGDSGPFHYKRSRHGNATIDRATTLVLRDRGEPYEIEDFTPYGYDERQYCSPGFNLAVGSLTRTPYGRYPEYHTSADNLELVTPTALASSLELYLDVIQALEADRRYLNLHPKAEPQLGSRGLYSTLGGAEGARERQLALLWTLNLCDGDHGVLDIAERSGLAVDAIVEAIDRLLEAELLTPCDATP